jgi:hypothetical protein
MARFRRLVNDLELKESALVGRRFTWSNERTSPTLERIDRWFGSVDWDALFPDASLTARSSSLSDHCPILLSTAVQFFSMRRFRFERVWTKMEGFFDIVKALWDDAPVHGDALQRLGYKLRALAKGLQRWNKRKVGSIRQQLSLANELILHPDRVQELRVLTTDEAWLRQSLKGKVLGLASLDRTIARQRARVAGLREGDANSLFSRILASSRRRRNFIATLRHGDQTTVDQVDKDELAAQFFVELLGRPQQRAHDISLAAAGLPALDTRTTCVRWEPQEKGVMRTTASFP